MIPESVLSTQWFAALAAFVAINTAIYVTLAIAKTLPRVYFRDYLPRNYERSETRSIYPDADEAGRPRATRRPGADPETSAGSDQPS